MWCFYKETHIHLVPQPLLCCWCGVFVRKLTFTLCHNHSFAVCVVFLWGNSHSPCATTTPLLLVWCFYEETHIHLVPQPLLCCWCGVFVRKLTFTLCHNHSFAVGVVFLWGNSHSPCATTTPLLLVWCFCEETHIHLVPQPLLCCLCGVSMRKLTFTLCHYHSFAVGVVFLWGNSHSPCVTTTPLLLVWCFCEETHIHLVPQPLLCCWCRVSMRKLTFTLCHNHSFAVGVVFLWGNSHSPCATTTPLLMVWCFCEETHIHLVPQPLLCCWCGVSMRKLTLTLCHNHSFAVGVVFLWGSSHSPCATTTPLLLVWCFYEETHIHLVPLPLLCCWCGVSMRKLTFTLCHNHSFAVGVVFLWGNSHSPCATTTPLLLVWCFCEETHIHLVPQPLLCCWCGVSMRKLTFTLCHNHSFAVGVVFLWGNSHSPCATTTPLLLVWCFYEETHIHLVPQPLLCCWCGVSMRKLTFTLCHNHSFADGVVFLWGNSHSPCATTTPLLLVWCFYEETHIHLVPQPLLCCWCGVSMRKLTFTLCHNHSFAVGVVILWRNSHSPCATTTPLLFVWCFCEETHIHLVPQPLLCCWCGVFVRKLTFTLCHNHSFADGVVFLWGNSHSPYATTTPLLLVWCFYEETHIHLVPQPLLCCWCGVSMRKFTFTLCHNHSFAVGVVFLWGNSHSPCATTTPLLFVWCFCEETHIHLVPQPLLCCWCGVFVRKLTFTLCHNHSFAVGVVFLWGNSHSPCATTTPLLMVWCFYEETHIHLVPQPLLCCWCGVSMRKLTFTLCHNHSFADGVVFLWGNSHSPCATTTPLLLVWCFYKETHIHLVPQPLLCWWCGVSMRKLTFTLCHNHSFAVGVVFLWGNSHSPCATTTPLLLVWCFYEETHIHLVSQPLLCCWCGVFVRKLTFTLCHNHSFAVCVVFLWGNSHSPCATTTPLLLVWCFCEETHIHLVPQPLLCCWCGVFVRKLTFTLCHNHSFAVGVVFLWGNSHSPCATTTPLLLVWCFYEETHIHLVPQPLFCCWCGVFVRKLTFTLCHNHSFAVGVVFLWGNSHSPCATTTPLLLVWCFYEETHIHLVPQPLLCCWCGVSMRKLTFTLCHNHSFAVGVVFLWGNSHSPCATTTPLLLVWCFYEETHIHLVPQPLLCCWCGVSMRKLTFTLCHNHSFAVGVLFLWGNSHSPCATTTPLLLVWCFYEETHIHLVPQPLLCCWCGVSMRKLTFTLCHNHSFAVGVVFLWGNSHSPCATTTPLLLVWCFYEETHIHLVPQPLLCCWCGVSMRKLTFTLCHNHSFAVGVVFLWGSSHSPCATTTPLLLVCCFSLLLTDIIWYRLVIERFLEIFVYSADAEYVYCVMMCVRWIFWNWYCLFILTLFYDVLFNAIISSV